MHRVQHFSEHTFIFIFFLCSLLVNEKAIARVRMTAIFLQTSDPYNLDRCYKHRPQVKGKSDSPW